ncbi:MAG TPA: type II secretion system protein GspM [Steroidobacteraceae bacterium]|jgi:general secretion pathway protein M|nr:type II secretion system protein GspM [Steroidobacteraceae bacterium]
MINLASLSRLGERERRMVIIGAAAALVLLILAVLMPLQQSVSASAQRIEHKRDDLSWLQSVAPQLGSLAVTAPAPLRESLVALADRTARDGGIGKSLVGSQPAGNGGLNVRFEQVPFDALVSWLSQLGDRYGVHAESATIEADAMPGVVNATLVLRSR